MVDGLNISNEINIAPNVDLGNDFFMIMPMRSIEDLGNNLIIVEPFSIDFYTTTPYQWAVANGYDYSEEIFITQWLNSLNGSSGGDGGVFIDDTPTDVTIGGLLENSVIENKTWQEIIASMVYVEKFPTLVNPSFVVSSSNGILFEVNASVIIQFLLQYNMGSIYPAYGTSGYRSGNLVKYMLGSTNIPYQSLNQVYNYPISVVSPVNLTFSFYADRLIGPQPKSNKGNNYDIPYPSGSIPYYLTIYFVYPFFATYEEITVTKQMLLQRFDSEYFECDMVSEDLLNNKQCAEFSIGHRTITGIKQFNTFSSTWEWINGSQQHSLDTFTVISIQKNINNTTVSYSKYLHNGPTIGERKLRFYTT